MLRINKLKPRARQSTHKSETPHWPAAFPLSPPQSPLCHHVFEADALETVSLTRRCPHPDSQPDATHQSPHRDKHPLTNGNKTRVCQHDHCIWQGETTTGETIQWLWNPLQGISKWFKNNFTWKSFKFNVFYSLNESVLELFANLGLRPKSTFKILAIVLSKCTEYYR